VTLAETEEPILYAYEKEMIPALARLDAEQENLAAAVRWSLAQEQPEVALRIGGALNIWAMHHMHYKQYAEWLEGALVQGKDEAPLYRARALDVVTCSHWNWGHTAEAVAAAQEELDMARAAQDPRWIGWGLLRLGLAVRQSRQSDHAHRCLQESLDIARQLGDVSLTGHIVPNLAGSERQANGQTLLKEWLPRVPRYLQGYLRMHIANAAMALGDLAGAETQLREITADLTEMENFSAAGSFTFWLTDIATLRGDYARARHLLERGQELVIRSGTSYLVPWGMWRKGWLAWLCGNNATASHHLHKSLDLAHELGDNSLVAMAQVVLALVACEETTHDQAEALCSQAVGILHEQDHDGRRWAFSAWGRTALFSGQTARAVELYRQALDHVRQLGNRQRTIEPLESLAWALGADGRAEEATQLLACAARERDEMGIVLFPADRSHHARAMETIRSTLDEAAFAATWTEGEALSLEEAVARALEHAADDPPQADHDE
jgi:tetratricopeptide (TPR) repeat protein